MPRKDCEMRIWGLVHLSLQKVIEFFPCREAAEKTLAEILDDEPDWALLLTLEEVEIGSEICLN